MSEPAKNNETTEIEPVITPIDADAPAPVATNWVKMGIDYGPIIAFGATFFLVPILGLANKIPAFISGQGIVLINESSDKNTALIWASAVLAITSLIAVLLGLLLEKRIAWVPLIVAIIGIPFAVLTVVFRDPIFVKIKMTIVNVLIGGGLLIALRMGKNPFKSLMGSSLPLKDEAWPRLTIYYALFYLAMAVTNEIIWRTQSDAVWVGWKMLSLIGGPILLTIALVPFLMKNMIGTDKE
ncbi:inner membrane-spanning protein YciB [Asticcacaulis endophyticus]|uniref:Inner membrane-spanning protein YciB n=1 Tax=Asticcacaulis endophyticus TaxID=1395890 RepID=A0A918ULV2_9CAUL|nr:septation protein IspZ [Asticcacaulis endophyticus]GGZ21077.1 putative intracellular septation protein A [Asticcacaulis endophyticus]